MGMSNLTTTVLGDCVEVMRRMPSNSVHAVVTDPPYEIGFMSKSWDASGIAFRVELWREALRVLKPGGYLLAFGGSRTYHRMACAIEDSGLELRDCIMWNYGSGFPKSLAVDKNVPEEHAETWRGWGTALKPAFEPIVVARKPLAGTVAANVLKHGTGAMNIDANRIPTTESLNGGTYSGGKRTPMPGDTRTSKSAGRYGEDGRLNPEDFKQPEGRWPANILLSHDVNCDEDGCVPGCPCALMDAQSGGDGASRYFNNLPIEEDDYPPFFYAAKASRKEREAGCENLPAKTATDTVMRDPESAGAKNPRAGANRGAGAPLYYCALCDVSLQGGRAAKACVASETGEHVPEARGSVGAVRNLHPTVKPVSVMKWCLGLVVPPGGVVLDPFMGSGTTGVAAVKLGIDFIGIEQSAEYIEIAKARIAHARDGE